MMMMVAYGVLCTVWCMVNICKNAEDEITTNVITRFHVFLSEQIFVGLEQEECCFNSCEWLIQKRYQGHSVAW